MRSARVVALLCLLATSACLHRAPSATGPLDTAAAGSAHGAALAGFRALWMQGEPEQAKALFEQALGQDAKEPWALLGLQQLATRAVHPEAGLAAALTLVEKNPRHALAAVAARIVFDTAGLSKSTDDLILARAQAALEAGADGDAAHLLRAALSLISLARGDLERFQALRRALGAPDTLTLVGPLSPFHTLAMGEPTALETTGDFSVLPVGPFGPSVARTPHFPDGRLSLAGESPQGDVYVLGTDFTVATGGAYVVRAVTSMDLAATLDGTPLFTRLTFAQPQSNLVLAAVELAAGAHRLVLRVAKEDYAGNLSLYVQRVDGAASDLTFTPAKGPAPRWSGVELLELPERLYPSALELSQALADEVGTALADVIAARDGASRDHDGAARRLLAVPESFVSPSLTMLRAELSLTDRSVPNKVANGRATRDLEATLLKDAKHAQAWLLSAQLSLDDSRYPEALEQLKKARAAHSPAGAPLELAEARTQAQLSVEAQAQVFAKAAEAALPGHCEALQLRYDIARRRDAIADADALLTQFAHCPGALSRKAEHLRSRGDLAAAAAVYAQLLERDEGIVPLATQLSQVHVGLKQFDAAVALLGKQLSQWPRNATLWKTLGDVEEAAGRKDKALAAREQALRFDGGDLKLRRAVHRAKTGGELLDAYAISTDAALKAYAASPGSEEAPAAFILDAAAVEAFPDGSSVDRIHIIQKALDQSGVQAVAEVSIPEGAEVLKLRTLKPDGRVLEPETIANKEGNSLPGVQVGDFVEYEFLQAHAPRGPVQPGFTSASFYFQIANQPNNWSTYTVVAPKGAAMKVDAHNMQAPPPTVEGDKEIFFHEEKRVPPYIPEPNGPPSGNEWLPFVTLGAGATGNRGLVEAYADLFLDKGQVTLEVERFAAEAATGKTGREAVQAVDAAVRKKLSGRDAGLSMSAASSVAQDRGSRTWLLYASLKALGFDARLAAVRTFQADPAAYVFPAENLLPYVCVVATLSDGTRVWMDPLVRNAPFGELPEAASGGREAFLFPEPGKPLEVVQTPPRRERPAKRVTLQVTLSEVGVLEGSGEELYDGFDAAQLAEALESISEDQRDQALQAALSRYFGGAELTGLTVKVEKEGGAKVSVGYRFKAPRFGRLETDSRMVVSAFTFPAFLGRRFLQLGARRTALFIDSSESSLTSVQVTLPSGWALEGPLANAKVDSPWGSFRRNEKQAGATLSVEEDFRLFMSRVPAKEYERFGLFAGEVDLLQQRDVLLLKR